MTDQKKKQPVLLTEKFVKNAKTQKKREDFADTAVAGFNLRVTAKGHKSFAMKMRDDIGCMRTITIGSYPEWTIKKARAEGERVRVELKQGQDPYKDRSRRRAAAKAVAQAPTLRELVFEAELVFAKKLKTWRPRGPNTENSEGRNRIFCVFEGLLDRPATLITALEFSMAANSYTRKSPAKKGDTANGQVSKAIRYLSPVLDWAANRRRYVKIGSGRLTALELADLRTIADPAGDDESITGERDRLLDDAELHAILPMLRYPAPIEIGAQLAPELDFRPAAMRFLLMTCARLDEVCSAKWKDIDFERGVWTKYDVKDTLGRIRDQRLSISPDILAFLKSLSTPTKIGSDELIFPNSVGGKLDNWDRFQKMLMRATGTSDWHRHDLRRTGATIMFEMDIGVSTIDLILGHINPLKSENVSASAPRYIVTQKLRVRRRNPQVEALATLGMVLDTLEKGLEELPDAAA